MSWFSKQKIEDLQASLNNQTSQLLGQSSTSGSSGSTYNNPNLQSGYTAGVGYPYFQVSYGGEPSSTESTCSRCTNKVDILLMKAGCHICLACLEELIPKVKMNALQK